LHTRVFINSLGLPTYEAKDLGNFELKHRKYPNWTQYFVVTGVEQREYFQVVFKAIQRVFPEAHGKTFRHIANGFLTPTTGKMSSRKGNVITGESLIADLVDVAKARAAESRAYDHEKLAEQIAVAAIKYQILKQGSGKDIIFDRERALSLEGDSGPYLQYTYARTHAIIAKAHDQGIVPSINKDAPPIEVVRLLHRFPEVVAHAAREIEPHIVAQYLLHLASAFNSWYGQEQILDGTPQAAHKVAITQAVNRTIKNGLYILGIPAPERM
jgi:arginyl-tRNA synthetase